MFTRKLVIEALLLLLSFRSNGQRQSKSVLLPEHSATTVHDIRRGERFSRTGWMPAKEDIQSLETHLSQVAGLSSQGWNVRIRIEHPEQYFRQYVGVVRAGQKLIYVNASCDAQLPRDWRDRLYVVSDGGTCFWQALYNPATKTFSHLTVNGRA